MGRAQIKKRLQKEISIYGKEEMDNLVNLNDIKTLVSSTRNIIKTLRDEGLTKMMFKKYKDSRDEKINTNIESLYNNGIGGKKFDELSRSVFLVDFDCF